MEFACESKSKLSLHPGQFLDLSLLCQAYPVGHYRLFGMQCSVCPNLGIKLNDIGILVAFNTE